MRPRAAPGNPSLVVFTVLTQAAAGLSLGQWALLGLDVPVGTANPVALGLLAVGTAAASLHLRRPAAARLVLANLRTSWLSREALLALLFGALLVAGLALRPGGRLDSPGAHRAVEALAALAGLALVVAISRLYMIRTVPVWDTWATPAAFLGTTLLLGSAGLVMLLALEGVRPGVFVLVPVAMAVVQLLLAFVHVRGSRRRGGAAAESAAILTGELRGLVVRRLGATVLGAILMPLATGWHSPRPALAAIAGLLLLVGEGLGRFLFYASHRRIGL